MSTTLQQTGKTIAESFAQFHKANPGVYEAIKSKAFQAIALGKDKISFSLIIEVVRWEVFIKTKEQLEIFDGEKKQTFKINNSYKPYYTRLFISDYPEHADKVATRRLRS